MASDSESSAGRPKRERKATLKRKEMEQEQSDRPTKRRSSSPKEQGKSTACSAKPDSLPVLVPGRSAAAVLAATKEEAVLGSLLTTLHVARLERKASNESLGTATSPRKCEGIISAAGSTRPTPLFTRLPSPALSITASASPQPNQPPKSRRPSPKAAKASPKPTPTPPTHYNCTQCGRQYHIPLSIDTDPVSRPMQARNSHPRLSRDSPFINGAHGRMRNELVDAQLRLRKGDRCVHIRDFRYAYVALCEQRLLEAESTHGITVPSQAQWDQGCRLPASLEPRGEELDTEYQEDLIDEFEDSQEFMMPYARRKRDFHEKLEREAKKKGFGDVQEYLPVLHKGDKWWKGMNMRTMQADGHVARMASKGEIESDLRLMGIDMKVGRRDERVIRGYGDVVCYGV